MAFLCALSIFFSLNDPDENTIAGIRFLSDVLSLFLVCAIGIPLWQKWKKMKDNLPKDLNKKFKSGGNQ